MHTKDWGQETGERGRAGEWVWLIGRREREGGFHLFFLFFSVVFPISVYTHPPPPCLRFFSLTFSFLFFSIRFNSNGICNSIFYCYILVVVVLCRRRPPQRSRRRRRRRRCRTRSRIDCRI